MSFDPRGLAVFPEVVRACWVTVRDFEVMADIGVYAHEIGAPQPLVVNVQLAVLPPEHDDVRHAFDYAGIRTYAQELATQRIALVETFAERLAEMCLRHPLVIEAEVRIDKPQAFSDCMAGARVKMQRVRFSSPLLWRGEQGGE